ncbi:hypothetical protein B0H10DRAFT_739122 [Mycena sp. CBHHK59/15]|nr:hypothetical protein B0H10DRAFT_739122 [Mycena sp. CBHHK59/15]
MISGSPPEWQNKATPYEVPADLGIFFVDQNGFQMPSAVLLPLITAVDKVNEANSSPSGFDWSAVDFVTDRNGLRKLMRWIDGINDEVPPKDFRIDLQLVGNTVLFNRWEKRTRENFSGFTYGFNFEKASTEPAPGCEESSGHHRIVKYDLNGLKMVVRFEVDACIPSPAKPAGSRKTVKSIDDLADSLAGINLSSSTAQAMAKKTEQIHGMSVIINGGTTVPHSSLIELTTRSERRESEYDWKDAYPQLFFSQTPHHFLSVHNRGKFSRTNKRKLSSSELQAVERTIQPSLKKLRVALDIIKNIVSKYGERGRLTLVCKDGVLKVFERDSQANCLPDDVIARFEA